MVPQYLPIVTLSISPAALSLKPSFHDVITPTDDVRGLLTAAAAAASWLTCNVKRVILLLECCAITRVVVWRHFVVVVWRHCAVHYWQSVVLKSGIIYIIYLLVIWILQQWFSTELNYSIFLLFCMDFYFLCFKYSVKLIRNLVLFDNVASTTVFWSLDIVFSIELILFVVFV